MKRIVVAAMMAAFCLAVAAPANAVRDYSSTALNIIPSGQWGAVPPPKKANDQAKMYDALTPLFDDVTKADLLRNFKSEKLGIKKQGRMTPRARAAQGRAHLPGQVQRAAHLRPHERRRDLGRGLGRGP